MTEELPLYLCRAMRDHPVVGMGKTPISARAGRHTYSRWEAWVYLQFGSYVVQKFTRDGDSPVQLQYVGPHWTVEDLANVFGWRPQDARTWVSELPEAEMISDELAERLLARISRRLVGRREGLPSSRRSAVLNKTSGKCVYCGVKITTNPGLPNSYHADHVLAVVRGGSDDVANLVPSCRSCNLRKRDKTVAELFRWNGDDQ